MTALSLFLPIGLAITSEVKVPRGRQYGERPSKQGSRWLKEDCFQIETVGDVKKDRRECTRLGSHGIRIVGQGVIADLETKLRIPLMGLGIVKGKPVPVELEDVIAPSVGKH